MLLHCILMLQFEWVDNQTDENILGWLGLEGSD